MKLSNGFAAAVLLTVAVPVCAQSLAEIAKKEQARRKASPPAAKTYTNEDLKKLPPAPDGAPKPGEKAKADDPAKPGDPGKPTEVKSDAAATAEPAKDEKYWRGRIAAVREDLRRNEMFRDGLQSRINVLAADFGGLDDPFQRAKIADERQKAVVELARVTGDIDKAGKLLGDIEEEARRAGVPPGWVR